MSRELLPLRIEGNGQNPHLQGSLNEQLVHLIKCALDVIRLRLAAPSPHLDALDTLHEVEILLTAIHHYARSQTGTFEHKEAHDGH